jgi:hypothetical protein
MRRVPRPPIMEQGEPLAEAHDPFLQASHLTPFLLMIIHRMNAPVFSPHMCMCQYLFS